MTLRFLDSCDHYASADLFTKWSSFTGTQPTIASAGRRGTSALRITGGTQSAIFKTLDAQQTWTVGLALNAANLPNSNRPLITLLDGSTSHVDVYVKTDGTFMVTRNATVLGTSVATLVTGGYSYVEFKAKIDDSAGTYEVRLNGVNILSATGVDTRNGGNASANVIRLGSHFVGGNGGNNWDHDDIYICDGQGSVNNSFLGDVRVDCYLPAGNGNTSGMTGSDSNSVDNYLLVDESSQNGDTDYVQSSVATTKDTYAFADMTHTPTSIYGLQINMTAKKDDSGTRSICSVIRSGGSDSDGTSQALSTSYADYMQVSETDPNTSAAWTKTNFNAVEVGVKVSV